MLYVLSGSDHYRRAGFVRELVEERRTQYPDIAVQSFDCADEGALLDAYAFVSATNLFEGGKKICVCAHGATVLDDPLLRRLAEAAQRVDHIVFLVEDFEGGLSEAYRALLADIAYKEKEFKSLSPAHQRVFAQTYAQTHGYDITSGACAFLSDVFVRDTWGLCSELDVLGASGKHIDEQAVRANDMRGGFLNAFAYAQGMLRASTRGERLAQWELALLSHTEPMFLFNIMAKSVSDKKQVALLVACDRYIKSGLLGPDQALVSFCCSA
ncbi:MAG: hypothetical protein WC246_00145 [Candidatus Paceibacterota bacterium]|jgi:DNA polymerase III delta subunit